MNKPQMVLATKGLRVAEEADGGDPSKFDPMSVLSNTKVSVSADEATINEPPIEEILMARTLWPESQKLYGHAFEVFCVAASHRGDCAASACKTKQEQYAAIIIWKIAVSEAFKDIDVAQ